MFAKSKSAPAPGAARPRLVNGPLMLVFLADFGALTGFYLLLPVVPQYATAAGMGDIGAGMTTAVLMLSTVATEFVTPRLAARFGYRAVLAVGLVLLGLPALALPISASMPLLMAVCFLRGTGLAIIFVVCGALSAELIPVERRGEGLGVFGVVAGLPAVIAMPVGVWLAGQVGYTPVFVSGALVALAGLAALPGLPGRTLPAEEQPLRMVAGLRTPALLRPSIVFAATATGAGVIATFLPSAMSRTSEHLVAAALLVNALAATVSRWWAGRYSDRRGAAGLLVPGALVTGLGMLMLVLVSNPVAVLAAMVLVGCGFGVVQNVSMALMLDRVPPSGYGTVSAIWSVAYDVGYGVGAAGAGFLAASTGYPVAFGLNGLVIIAVLGLAMGTIRVRVARLSS